MSEWLVSWQANKHIHACTHIICNATTHTVLYVPEIGGLGCDMEAMANRLAVYRDTEGLGSFTDHEAGDLMDATFPYQPELSHYKVASIVRG